MAEKYEKQARNDWHSLSTEKTLKILGSIPEGLSSREAERRLSDTGPNRLLAAKRRNSLVRFLLQFHNVLIYVLIGSSIITAALDHWIDTGVILAVVVANALIGFIQEGKAEKAMNAIRHMLAPHANVMRDGERIGIDSEKLVPGDIVLLEAGDKVPADIRLLNAHGMSVQEAILTGESVPVEKHIRPVSKEAVLGDRACVVFSGTLVTSGQAEGVVVATGSYTEIGRISDLLSEVETLTTPLVTQMSVFAKWLTVFILIIASLLLAFVYFISHYDFTEMFMAVVGLSVAAVPEGLPAVLTITLAVGVQAMAKRNAIVRRLPAIETLGSVSVICTDKTGTLTLNEMTVVSVLNSRDYFTLEAPGYAPESSVKSNGKKVNHPQHPILEELARAATLCNDASLRQNEGGWSVEGDPMEGALLAFAAKANVDPKAERRSWTRTDAIPFDSNSRYMATLNHDHDGHAFIFVKGAPEKLIEMCSNQRFSNVGEEELDKDYWYDQIEAIAAQGQRVLAFAVKSVKADKTVLQHRDIDGSLTLLGMVGMIDPPRSEAVGAVSECHKAGIRVKMITGDHAKTAAAIGKQIGLQNFDKVLTGSDLDNMDDASLYGAVLTCDIFARTSPEHKLRLVMALQSHGMTVAMTGDGVNDAPALKRADAGIAMGKKGSEAAKEAAELVLADDNFASIVAAIREGRTVYDNIKKVISWTLPTNAGEAMTIIVALLFGMTLPVTPIQILWVNLITAVTLGIALAFEPTEAGTMSRSPRPRHEPLLTGELIWHIIFVSLLFLAGVFGIYHYAIAQGNSIESARTMALNTLVVMEIFHLFFIRNIYGTSLTWQGVKGTKIIRIVVAAVTVAQFAITYLPPLQAIFNTEAVPFRYGVLIFFIGVALFALIETEKQMRLAFRRRQKRGSL
ncbi:MAG: cation-transporting P-type ATPase [Alphaproteobacteria bacterium]|nr:cation-transporting P-type ATPase [Alphaproteobacteria bacterium]